MSGTKGMSRKNPLRVLAKDKPCVECGVRSRSGKDSRYCTECRTTYMQAYRASHPQHKVVAQRWHRKHIYGLSDVEYKALYLAQAGLCAACGSQEKLVVDHDHVTGNVRGLLCHTCNVLLGSIEKDQERVEKVMEYFDKYCV
jgi:hypothetical protein